MQLIQNVILSWKTIRAMIKFKSIQTKNLLAILVIWTEKPQQNLSMALMIIVILHLLAKA